MEVIHKKSGDTYVVTGIGIINATNGREDERMIMYQKKGDILKTFVREHKEFFEKFTVEDIVTEDREQFLLSEMKHFGKRSIERFKVYMKDSDTACENCGVYYWKGCKKRCKCI